MSTCRFGVITDLHYARRSPVGSREYAQSLDKLRHTVGRFNEAQLDLMFVLGDLVDAPDDADHEREALNEIVTALRGFNGTVRVLAGNHDLVNFTKPQFLAACGQAEPLHGAFDHAGVRMILLDGCFTHDDAPYGGAPMDWADSKVADAQLPFLADQLRLAEQAAQPAVVLMHQTLTSPDPRHNVDNAEQLLDMLSQTDNVALVISGHYHTGGLEHAHGVPCFTVPATVEQTVTPQTAGRIVTVGRDRTFTID